MNLSKTYVQAACWKQSSTIQITLDNDFNVSDTKVDIERIIQEKGRLNIHEIKAMTNKCLVRGNFECAILYNGDDGSGQLQAMEVEIPFEELINMDEVQESDKVYVHWDVEDLRSSVINSRKINIRSLIALHINAVRMKEEEIATALESGKQFWTKNQKVSLTLPFTFGKDQIRIREEVLIPANRSNMMDIIWYQENLDHLDVKLQDGCIAVRGQISIFVLYRDEMMENTVNDVEVSIPIEGRIEMSEAHMEMIPDVKIRLDHLKLDIRDDSDGEARVLAIEAILAAEIVIYKEDTLQLLEDIYAPNVTYIPEKKMLEMEHLVLKNKSQYPIRERIRLKGESARMLQICHAKADVKIDQLSILPDGIDVEGVVSLAILYISSDDRKPVNSSKAMLPFNYRIETAGIHIKDRYEVYPGVEQLSVTMTDSDEIEVKMLISLDASVLKTLPVEVVCQVKEEPLDYVQMESMPSMIGHVVTDGDTLWTLAKKYYANPEEICEINDLKEDKLPIGQPILITKNMEIFK